MSKADELYRATCLDILEHGVWDTGQRDLAEKVQ